MIAEGWIPDVNLSLFLSKNGKITANAAEILGVTKIALVVSSIDIFI